MQNTPFNPLNNPLEAVEVFQWYLDTFFKKRLILSGFVETAGAAGNALLTSRCEKIMA